MSQAESEEPQGLRTTLTIPSDLIDQIDDLLHQGKRSGALSRNLKRNPFIVRLLRERVAQLAVEQAGPPERK